MSKDIFGNENSNLLRAGNELVKQAKADKEYRKQWANKELGQMTKDIASYMCDGMRSRVVSIPKSSRTPKFLCKKRQAGKWVLNNKSGKLEKVK